MQSRGCVYESNLHHIIHNIQPKCKIWTVQWWWVQIFGILFEFVVKCRSVLNALNVNVIVCCAGVLKHVALVEMNHTFMIYTLPCSLMECEWRKKERERAKKNQVAYLYMPNSWNVMNTWNVCSIWFVFLFLIIILSALFLPCSFWLLQESRVSLLRIVEYYNFVREKTEKCEFDIIAGQVKMIEADLTVLLENFTWINFGMWINLLWTHN